MSIEANIERIADALESIAANLTGAPAPAKDETKPKATRTRKPKAEKPKSDSPALIGKEDLVSLQQVAGEIVQTLGPNQQRVMQLLAEFGATKLSELQAASVEDFKKKLLAIPAQVQAEAALG